MFPRRPIDLIGAIAVAILALGSAATCRADDGNVEVRIVAILASSEDGKIDKRLADMAPQLKLKNAAWKGFTIERQLKHSLQVGEKATLEIFKDCEVQITFKGRDEKDCPTLLLTPPAMKDVKYSCCCGKYFPIVTHYVTRDKKQLILAVMVEPPPKKKPNPARPRD